MATLFKSLFLLSFLVACASFGKATVDCSGRYRQLRFVFTDAKPEPPPRVVDNSRPDMYLVQDINHEDFEISGKVEGRDLYVSFQTKLEDGTRSQLYAKEHFPKIVKHFEGRFDRIMGKWQIGPMATNLNTFNFLTGTKKTPEEAALNTWTGRQAAAQGYTKVIFKTLEGRRGKYTSVVVAFEKP